MNECRIILALDPFEKRLKPTALAMTELRYWARKLSAKIQAIYALPESDQYPLFNHSYTRAYDLLKERVREMELGVPVDIRVIWDRDALVSHPAELVADHARVSGAHLILVSSHGRRWLSRIVLGSFAEKLLGVSPIPVLFFGHLPDPHESLRRMMFTTDFSESSRIAFEIFLEQVKPISPEVILFHAASYPNLITGMTLTGVGAYLPEEYWKVMKESLYHEGENWVKIAEAHGIRARAMISEGIGDVAGSILRIAREERVSVIGLSSLRSEWQKAVFGSVSTHIFRDHRHSVWVCGPRVLESERLRTPKTSSLGYNASAAPPEP
jgi:nucleotide-binding universal stress UspA family protein